MADVDPIADRRQRAREAFADSIPVAYGDADTIDQIHASIDNAIEAATQVKITADILRPAALGYPVVEEIVKAAFRAAGFEVVE